MPNPNYNAVAQAINTGIVTNHNNEITALVLNPILLAMLNFASSSVGDLNSLNTDEKENLVLAINEALARIDNIDTGVKVITGEEDPNVLPPIESFGIGDMYSQILANGQPLYLYIWTGNFWYRFSIPNLEEVIAQGGNINVSQLNNDGDGVNPFVTALNLNGMSITANPAASEINLVNDSGQVISTISVAFLNNEGTTFVYNDETKMLELWNDAGEKLSEIPVSSFVSNMVHSASFNATTPSILEFKDVSGNIVFSVSYSISNIAGLVSALNLKANTDGSNVVPMSDWNINASTANAAITFGDAYGEFLTDGTGQTHAVGYDISNNKVKRYTKSSFKLWLAIAIENISGLADILALKANDSDVIKNIQASRLTDANTPVKSGQFYIDENTANKPPITNNGVTTLFHFETEYIYTASQIVFERYSSSIHVRVKSGGVWQGWKTLANDADVIHKTRNETKTGNLTLNDILKVLGGSVYIGGGANPFYINVTDGTNYYDGFRIVKDGIDMGFNIDNSLNAHFYRPLEVPASQNSTHAVNSGEVDSRLAIAANNVASNYLPINGASTKYGTLTFNDSPVIPPATLYAHPITKGVFDGVSGIVDTLQAGAGYDVNNSYDGSSGWFSTLNTQYPDAPRGFRVFAIYNGSGESENAECEKLAGEWAIKTGLAGIVSGS